MSGVLYSKRLALQLTTEFVLSVQGAPHKLDAVAEEFVEKDLAPAKVGGDDQEAAGNQDSADLTEGMSQRRSW